MAVGRALERARFAYKWSRDDAPHFESTAQNLSHITDEDSQLNLALIQFRTLGENLNKLTGPDSSLSTSLANVQQITDDLTKNDNIEVTLKNFRASSEKLKSTLSALAPSLEESGRNVKDATATLRTEPWRLIWPSTKKYASEAAPTPATQSGTRTERRGRSTPAATRTTRR